MQIRTAGIDEWRDFLARLPFYSFYQLPEWSLACQKSTPHARAAPRFFLFEDGTKVLVPLVETRIRLLFKMLESVPAGYGGLICNRTPTTNQISSILSHLKSSAAVVIIHPHPSEFSLLHEADRVGFTMQGIHTHVVSSFHAELEQRVTSNAKESIGHALEKGMEIYEGSVKDIRHPYYDIYTGLCKALNKSAEDMMSLAFFERLMELGTETVRLFFVRQGDETLCGTIMGYGKGECHRVHSAYGYNPDSYYAMNLLLWTIIQDANKRGYKCVNLGASRPNDSAADKYKELFGADRLEYGYYIYESPWWKLAKKLRRAIRKVA